MLSALSSWLSSWSCSQLLTCRHVRNDLQRRQERALPAVTLSLRRPVAIRRQEFQEIEQRRIVRLMRPMRLMRDRGPHALHDRRWRRLRRGTRASAAETRRRRVLRVLRGLLRGEVSRCRLLAIRVHIVYRAFGNPQALGNGSLGNPLFT